MIASLIDMATRAPLAGLMVVVATGYLLGELQWRRFSLGPAAGTLGIALLLGYLGLSLEAIYGGTPPELTVGYFGFALFIYSVGFDAGPQFVTSLRMATGWKYVVVGSIVVLLASLLSVGTAHLFGFDASTAAGVLAGGMTSAPAFAAASAEASDVTRLSIAFALTYPFGVVGLVLAIAWLPRLTHTDISRGSPTEEELPDDGVVRAPAPELTRAFEVRNEEIAGRPLGELRLPDRTGCFISRIHRGDDVLVAHAGTTLQIGDNLMAVGRLYGLQQFERLVGHEVYSAELRERMPLPRRILVTSRQAHGRTLAELDLLGRHHCMVSKIERGREPIDPSGSVALMRGDVIEVVGHRDAVREVAHELGRFEPSAQTTDIALYAGGIVLGLWVGTLRFQHLGLDFTLGAAGGLLLMGVLLSWGRQLTGMNANVPRAARQLVRDLGVLLFVSETGVAAGYALREGISFAVWRVLVAGATVTLMPVLCALGLAKWLRMRNVDIWGSICGGMTSSAALNAVRRASDSNEPAVSYATAYAIASILVAIAGQAVVRAMS